jgi:arsenate reductase (thioredoxin)
LGKERVLFVCVHNSARSQMAEALLNHMAGDRFGAESAGLEPGRLNALAVEAMEEIGIDISHKATRDVFELFKHGRRYSYVITVCDEASGERCPIFAGISKKIGWSFPDPAALQGSYDERLKQTIIIGDQIKHRIEQWLRELAITPVR